MEVITPEIAGEGEWVMGSQEETGKEAMSCLAGHTRDLMGGIDSHRNNRLATTATTRLSVKDAVDLQFLTMQYVLRTKT